jgi:hypothetical protein
LGHIERLAKPDRQGEREAMIAIRSPGFVVARSFPPWGKAIAVIAALAILAPAAQARQDDEARRRELERRVQEAAQPGPEHERLAALTGEWNLRFAFSPSPAASPVTGTGSASNRMILGGRFLQSESVVQLGNGRSEGLLLLGYDRRASRYTMLGLDTYGTHYVEAEGPFDEGSGAMVMYGEEHDPIARHTERYTVIVRLRGPDEYVQEVVSRQPDGTSHTAVKITYSRKR